MSRPGHRRLRLPQHCDYILIPASPDFCPPDEKSPLPAIIVTPSSPSCSADFSIAFVAPPPKPSVFKRVSAAVAPLQTKARITLVLILFFFILSTHLFAHRFATRHPLLRFDKESASITAVDALAPPLAPSHGHSHRVGWLDWSEFWQSDENIVGERHEFVVTDSSALDDSSQARGTVEAGTDADAQFAKPLTTR